MTSNSRDDLPKIALRDLGRVTGGIILTTDGQLIPCTPDNFMKLVWNQRT
jgi:hypothetical protein